MEEREEVKVFCESSISGNIEKSVNDWLRANPNINIITREVACSSARDTVGSTKLNYTICTIAIFFRRKQM